MRSRGGVFALITYTLYTLFSVISFLFIHFELLEGIGIPGVGIIILILHVSAYTLAVFSIIMLVLKLLHMGTRFVLFGIPCLLFDAYVIWHVVPSIISIGAITGEMLVLILWLLLSVGSFISNVRSF